MTTSGDGEAGELYIRWSSMFCLPTVKETTDTTRGRSSTKVTTRSELDEEDRCDASDSAMAPMI